MTSEHFKTDGDRTVQFHGVRISGNLGPNAVVESDGVCARNISSGEGAGDLYQVRSRDTAEITLETLLHQLHQEASYLSPDRFADVEIAIKQAWKEVEKGKEVDLSALWMAFNYVREVAASFFPCLLNALKTVAQRHGTPAVADLAKRFQ
jgi:hypothetical protein